MTAEIIAVGAACMIICEGCLHVYSQLAANPLAPPPTYWEPPCCPRCGLPAFLEE